MKHGAMKVEMNNMSTFPGAGLLDLIAGAGQMINPPPRKRGRRGNQAGGATSYDVVKAHLASGKVISPSIAMETYGISTGSLSAVISRLRGESKWHIASVPITGENGHRSVSYHLIKPTPVQADDTETRKPVADKELTEVSAESATACRYAVGSTPTSNITFRFSKDGPELRLIGEGEPDDRPFCKMGPEDIQLLGMFVQMAGGK